MIVDLLSFLVETESTVIVNITLDGFKWRLFLPEQEKHLFNLNLVLSEVGNLYEHEKVVSDPTVMRNLTESIRDLGFLHPIIATEHQGRYFIADGTHRTLALKDIKARDEPGPLSALIMEIKPGEFARGSWALMFNEGLANVEGLLSGCWATEEVVFRTAVDINELFSDEQLGVIFRTRGKAFGLYSTVTSRYEFLKAMKNVDDSIGDPSTYVHIDEAVGQQTDCIIFSPPRDDLGDVALLVKHPELRRSKGSRTIIPVRPMFLPIPLKVLRWEREKATREIAQRIDSMIDCGTIRLALPGLQALDFCGEIWDHYLIIFDMNTFSRSVPQQVDSKILDLLKKPEVDRV